jgi:predicted ester cyclase
VVSRLTLRAAHLGDLSGPPATGKPVTIKVIDIQRIVVGQIVEYWGRADFLGLLQQLGAVPAVGRPNAE